MPEPTCDQMRGGACLVGLGGRCYGRKNHGVCRQVGRGHEGYRALAARLAEPERVRPADPEAPRVALITPSCHVGGAEVWMDDLMRTTARALAWDAVVLLFPQHSNEQMRARLNVHAPVLDARTGVPALSRCDAVVLWGCDLAEAEAVLGCALPPVVLVAHGIGPWTERAMRSASRAAVLTAVSGPSVATFPADQRGRVRIIPNMVDPARLQPSVCRDVVRAKWGVRPDQRALVMVGRLSDEKNPSAITEAVAELHRRGETDWIGVHVGDGLGQPECEALAARIAPGLVRFTGVTRDVPSALNAADLVALPSHEEACPMVALEAWSIGAPLVAARVGILTDPRYTGLYRGVSPGCSGAELAEAVLAEAAAPMRERLRRILLGREAAAEDFGAARFARDWTEAITSAAAKPALVPGF